ncbi:tetratricopeptide repeat protein [Coraliomargarita parva]|uniref:tetratricopeptide repeat protein n=1 Tax=Coraliomargarita parva TaxID=3014050 RepID=UPI0022B346C9|nr:hypothetical protein [Coraliomargarita parva]
MSKRCLRLGTSGVHSIRALLVYVLLLGVLLAVYWPTLEYGPVIDDPAQIEWVQGFDSYSEVFGMDATRLYRPVKNIAFYFFARDGELFDLRVASLMIFSAFGAAYYFFACRFMKPPWAFFSACLLVLHPAQVASVVFPSAINNIFSAVFIVLFCATAAEFLMGNYGYRLALPLLVVFGLLALFGYELGVVVVPLSVLLVLYHRRSAGVPRSVCLIVLSLVLLGTYLIVRGDQNAITEMAHLMIPPSASDLDLFCSAPYYTLKHLQMALIPFGHGGMLLVDDPRGSFLFELPYWIFLATLLLLALWLLERRRSRVAFGLLFFIFAMTPLSNWIPLRNGPITNYYLLLPLCGLALVTGVVFERLSVSVRPRIILLAGAVLLGVSAICGSYRASWWDSQYSLYELTVKNYPENWLAWNNWGVTLVSRGEGELALGAFKKSEELAEWYVEPFENRMWLLLLMGHRSDVVQLVEARDGKLTPGLVAALAIAYLEEKDWVRGRHWAEQVDPGRLKPNQALWLERSLTGSEAR